MSETSDHPDRTRVEKPDLHKLGDAIAKPIDIRSVATTGLFFLAILFTLYFARSFLIPIVLAVLLDFLFNPVIRVMKRARIPESVGAGLVLLFLVGVVVGAVYGLAEPAKTWAAKAPESMARVEAKLQKWRRPMAEVTKTAEKVESMGQTDKAGTPEVQIKGPSLTAQVFGGTASLLGAVGIVAFLLYFLMAAGDLFLQKLISVLPQFSDKKKAVSIARATESQVSTYLLTVTLINASLGALTALALYLLGMPNPVLWGVISALLNFVPYLGGLVNTVLLLLAAMVTFDDTTKILLVPECSLRSTPWKGTSSHR